MDYGFSRVCKVGAAVGVVATDVMATLKADHNVPHNNAIAEK